MMFSRVSVSVVIDGVGVQRDIAVAHLMLAQSRYPSATAANIIGNLLNSVSVPATDALMASFTEANAE